MPQDKNLIVHWGVRVRSEEIPENTRVLNNYARLNGLDQLNKFNDANILCPRFCIDLIDAQINVKSGYTLWGRNLEHTQGYDIVGSGYRPATKRRPERWNSKWLAKDYWVEAIPASDIINEWRIHVFMGRVIGRGLKVQTEPAWRKLPVRSRNNGWTMIHTETAPAIVKTVACQATKAVGYDFGAVDILETKTGPVVLEVNSAPALRSDYTASAYLNALTRCTAGKWNKWRDKEFVDGEPDTERAVA
jgi:hypothetical protein